MKSSLQKRILVVARSLEKVDKVAEPLPDAPVSNTSYKRIAVSLSKYVELLISGNLKPANATEHFAKMHTMIDFIAALYAKQNPNK